MKTVTLTDRKNRIEERIEKLIRDFSHYLMYYDEHTPFNKPDQLKSHVTTIRRRRELGSVHLAATDREFCKSLTLDLAKLGHRTTRFSPDLLGGIR
jgi:hypothetical protein